MKQILVVKTNPANFGFFHYMMQVFAGLYYGYKHFIPVVIDFRENHPYATTPGENVWDTFFEPPYGITAEEAYVMESKGEAKLTEVYWANEPEFTVVPPNSFGGPILKKEARICGAVGARGRINPKPFIKSVINDYYNTNMKGHMVLGVHRRGLFDKDYLTHPIPGEPNITLEQIFDIIDNILSEDPFDKIYLSTPELGQEEAFKKHYGDIMLARNVTRYEPGCTSEILITLAPPFQCAQEVIIDAFLLSKCDLLLRGFSGVATAACFINQNLPYIQVNKLFM